MIELTQKYVKELFDYRDGELYWKVTKAQRVKIGDHAGGIKKDGYREVKIDGKGYLAHRLIFLYHYDYLPQFLDHIDGNPLNNDITNLREATIQENNWNVGKYKVINGKSTSSEYKGVTRYERDKKYRAQIVINRKRKHLGYFTSEIDAAMAYDKVAIEYFGEFAKLNFD